MFHARLEFPPSTILVLGSKNRCTSRLTAYEMLGLDIGRTLSQVAHSSAGLISWKLWPKWRLVRGAFRIPLWCTPTEEVQIIWGARWWNKQKTFLASRWLFVWCWLQLPLVLLHSRLDCWSNDLSKCVRKTGSKSHSCLGVRGPFWEKLELLFNLF